MKTLQFTIPVVPGKTVTVQEDIIPHFYPYLHRHKEAQLIWILKGEGTLIADNSMHIFAPNDIFMLAPNQSHVFRSSIMDDGHTAPDTVHTISLFYDPNGELSSLFQLPELTQLSVFLREYSGGFKLPGQYFEAVSRRITKIKESKDLDQMMHFLHMLNVFCRMNPKPEHLSEMRNEYITDGEGLRMGNIYNFIMQHFHQELTLEDAAAVAHLTPQAFCRYFKRHTGLTFIAFLNKMRVSEACKRLARGDFENISSVAYQCGFNSITNFNRVFKTLAGTSPKNYLTRYRSNAY